MSLYHLYVARYFSAHKKQNTGYQQRTKNKYQLLNAMGVRFSPVRNSLLSKVCAILLASNKTMQKGRFLLLCIYLTIAHRRKIILELIFVGEMILLQLLESMAYSGGQDSIHLSLYGIRDQRKQVYGQNSTRNLFCCSIRILARSSISENSPIRFFLVP